MTEILIGENENWTNKGTDKQYMAGSFLHSITRHTRCPYQNSKSYVKQLLRNILQKKLANKQTLLQTKQRLYTPYILCIPGV